MSIDKRRCYQIIIGIALAVLIGCKPKVYQVHTRLTAHGQFHRDIMQPLDDSLPPEAWKQDAAPSSQPAEDDLDPSWKDLWKQFEIVPEPAEAEKGRYFHASGEFEAAEKIPPSYHVDAKSLPNRTSTDEILHEVDDYFLFSVDRWEENLTEIISLTEYVDAIDELIRMTMPSIQASFEELYGKEYDLKVFQNYLQGLAARALRHYCLWVYQYHPRQITEISEKSLLELSDILDGAEFELPITDDNELDTELIGPVWDQFIHDLLENKVRHKSGRPLTSEEADQFWERIQIDFGADPKDLEKHKEEQSAKIKPTALHTESQPSKEETPRFFAVLQKQVKERFGDDFAQEFSQTMTKLGGVHNNNPAGVLWSLVPDSLPLDMEGKKFRYLLELPGPVIETNGVRVADSTIRWDFTKGDLFPDGFSMIARSIRWNRDAEKKLFGRVVLKDLSHVIPIMDAVPPKCPTCPDSPIHEALKKSIKHGNLKPIEALAHDEDEGVRKAAGAILELKKAK